MPWDEVFAILGTAGAVLCGLATWWMYRDSHGKGKKDERREEVQRDLSPLSEKIATLAERLENTDRHSEHLVKSAVLEAMQPMREDIAVLKKQSDMFEDFFRRLRYNAAMSLHQPDPRRVKLDRLLEELNSKTINAADLLLLRNYLQRIRDWEPGTELEFPVYAGEPFNAGVLLSMLEHEMH